MSLFVIGIILLVIAIVGAKSNEAIYRAKGLMTLGAIVLMIVGLITSSVQQIQPGEIGVLVLFGKVQDDVIYEGLNFVLPVMDVRNISIKTRNYTMSGTDDEAPSFAQSDPVKVLSKDGLEVTIDLTVLYRVLPTNAPNILRQIGFDFEAKIVRPITRSRIRETAVLYDAVQLVSEDREEFQVRLQEAIEKDFQDRGLVMENVLVRSISLPESVRLSIENKITAIQEAERMEFVLDKGRQEAELKRVEARGISDAQKILAEGLSDKVLQYEMIKVQKELAESQNSKIIIMGGGKGNLPLILNDR